MIEVNLNPGATRRPSKRRAASWKLPELKGRPKIDRILALAVAAWIVGPALLGWMYLSTQHQKTELTLDLEQARQDSAHYATVIQANERLRARRDTIARKLQLIQDIDANRYVWAHVLDEVSRVLPAYTWLVTVAEIPDTTSKAPRFEIDGRTGNTFALTEFMKDLEDSPFVRGVRLISTSIVKEHDKEVHAFAIEARYETPPADAIQTVPLFKPEE